MLKQEPQRRGKDFLIGFIPSLILALIAITLLLTIGDLVILNLLFFVGIGLSIAAIVAFIRLRAFIALGIITVLVATPLLLIGSCFAFIP